MTDSINPYNTSKFQYPPISDILPEEILQNIFNKLPISELKKINFLNSRIHSILYNTILYTNVKISNYDNLVKLSDSIILDKRLQDCVREIEFDIATLQRQYADNLKYNSAAKQIDGNCSKLYNKFWNNSYDSVFEDFENDQNYMCSLRSSKSISMSMSSTSITTFLSTSSTTVSSMDTSFDNALNMFDQVQKHVIELEEPSVLIDRILSTLNRDKLKHISLKNITKNFKFPYTHSTLKLKTENNLKKISLSCSMHESTDLNLDNLISNTMISGLTEGNKSKSNNNDIEILLENYSIDLVSAQVNNPILSEFLKSKAKMLTLNNCRLILFLQSRNFFSLMPNLSKLCLIRICNIFTLLFILDNLCHYNDNHRCLKCLTIDFSSSIFHDSLTEVYDFYGPLLNYNSNNNNDDETFVRRSSDDTYLFSSYFLSAYQSSFSERFHKLFLISKNHNLERIDLVNVKFINKHITPSPEDTNLQEFNLYLFLETLKYLNIINIHLDETIKVTDYPSDWNDILFPITMCNGNKCNKKCNKKPTIRVFSSNKQVLFCKE